jgi:hypothetical protein
MKMDMLNVLHVNLSSWFTLVYSLIPYIEKMGKTRSMVFFAYICCRKFATCLKSELWFEDWGLWHGAFMVVCSSSEHHSFSISRRAINGWHAYRPSGSSMRNGSLWMCVYIWANVFTCSHNMFAYLVLCFLKLPQLSELLHVKCCWYASSVTHTARTLLNIRCHACSIQTVSSWIYEV